MDQVSEQVSAPRRVPQSGQRPVEVTVHIPAALRRYCGGASSLGLLATTVRGALEYLEQHHAALHCNICDETGTVRRHVNLFVNTSHMRDRNGLDTPLAQGDEVTILAAVSGG